MVKIFRKQSKVRKSCKGSSYITLKVLSNTKKLIFIAFKTAAKLLVTACEGILIGQFKHVYWENGHIARVIN
jgi:hypothetical protein